MSTFANQLKSEISRLAKKEVRAETQALKKASAQYRSDIAKLKRRIAGLELQVKKFGKGVVRTKAAAEKDDESDTALRFRVEGFSALRKKLGITAAEMGQLLGVSQQSVYHWESGKSKPRASQLASIAAVRKLGKRAVAEKLSQPMLSKLLSTTRRSNLDFSPN
jgi:DNA-binding transcriptional regulator YiaG